jgi:chemotaxis protein MotB
VKSIKRKKEAHHGGSWKVAYADFVTAMMALFLCLWLTSQDVKIKEAVERAFRNPFSNVTKESVGIIPNKDVRFRRGNGDHAPLERRLKQIAQAK